MGTKFAYSAEFPSMSGLLRSLFNSELFEQLKGVSMDSLAQYRLRENGSRTAAVFLTQWRDSSSQASSYDSVTEAIATE